MWAQNFLEFGRHSYSEVTPSGAGCRIWGLADWRYLNRKFSLNIDGKDIAAELFRRTNKALTITGYRFDTIRELTNIDKVFRWAVCGASAARLRPRQPQQLMATLPLTAIVMVVAIALMKSSRSSAPELPPARTAAIYSTLSSVILLVAVGTSNEF